MKSYYATNRPMMKMSAPEMTSTRPQHENSKPSIVVASTSAGQKTIAGKRKN